MKRLLVAGLLAFFGALLITIVYKPQPLDTQLLHLQVIQTLPELADELDTESAELQALFLDYAEDPVLLAKARLALLRYPDMIRPIFLTYGENDEFQAVLRQYGEDITLPIHYFLTHEVFTLELMRSVQEASQSALDTVRRLWNDHEAVNAIVNEALSSEERGRFAIQFLQVEGYGFLGQFVATTKTDVAWIQTERVLEGINNFFASGIKKLETKLRTDETIVVGDLGWAALDVAVGVSALKVLRMGKAGTVVGGSGTFSQRSVVLGSGLWHGSVIGTRLVKYGAPAVLAYIAIRHPSVINSLLSSAAETLGLPVGLVQLAGWTLVLLPVLLLLLFVFRPLAWVMAGVVALLRWLDNLLRRRSLTNTAKKYGVEHTI